MQTKQCDQCLDSFEADGAHKRCKYCRQDMFARRVVSFNNSQRNKPNAAETLTVERLKAMWKLQFHKCCTCNCRLDGFGLDAFQIDHDHSTGKIRGLLCRQCNTTMGWVEKEGWCQRSIAYRAHSLAQNDMQEALLFIKKQMSSIHIIGYVFQEIKNSHEREVQILINELMQMLCEDAKNIELVKLKQAEINEKKRESLEKSTGIISRFLMSVEEFTKNV